MSTVLYVLLVIIVFLLIFTIIVVVHEGGHAFMSRRFGARVTEFFVGMPWGPEFSWQSPRSGIRYGFTFALLGGYTRISGMDPQDDPRAPLALALVNARGRIEPQQMAEVLDCTEEEARTILDSLVEWGSIDAIYSSEHITSKSLPIAYETTRRDANGLTVFDRHHDFSLPGGSAAGEPYFPNMSADEFYVQEQKHTYQGLNPLKRIITLVAGVFCNILLAFLLIVLYYCIHGVYTISLDTVQIEEGSVAEEIGMQAGDRVTEIDGIEITTYDELGEAIDAVQGEGTFELVYSHDGTEVVTDIELGDDEILGVWYGYGLQPLGIGEAVQYTVEYIGLVAQTVASLLIPTNTMDVLSNSTGVVGVAVMTSEAVSSGIWSVILLLAMISLSLGWMNLLPIPPLDGGKVLIELIQVVIRRPVPVRVQNALSTIGMVLILLLFVFVLVQDVSGLIGA